jgi:5-formyltetrahydrofolate cyclo-ligase
MDDSTSWEDISAWRKQVRAQFVAQRMAMSDEQHRAASARIGACLAQGFEPLAGMAIGFCWPYRREFDPRFVLRHWRERGAIAALPAVVDRKGPLEFREWWPGASMAPGAYGIPVPQGTRVLHPDAAIVPMNGFDQRGYRLGYGGGYFDRTLARGPRPIAIGVSFEAFRLPSIFPRQHDIAMDFIVTEAGIHCVDATGMHALDASACAAAVCRLTQERGLPRVQAQAAGALHGAPAYSSPPCYAHEFPGYFGEAAADEPPDPST